MAGSKGGERPLLQTTNEHEEYGTADVGKEKSEQVSNLAAEAAIADDDDGDGGTSCCTGNARVFLIAPL